MDKTLPEIRKICLRPSFLINLCGKPVMFRSLLHKHSSWSKMQTYFCFKKKSVKLK